MGDIYTRYRGTGDDGIGPSDAIWGRFPNLLELQENPSLGRGLFDNFVNAPVFASATSQSGYKTYQDTGVTIQGPATLDDGLAIGGNDADNDEGSITTGGGTGVLGIISDTAANARLLGFEASIKTAGVADNGIAWFLGLGEEGLAAANTLVDDTGEVASKDLIGFQVLQANGDSVNSIYRKAGQAKQAVKSGVHAMVAATYVKLGLVYDPAASASKKVSFYVDGVEQADYVTSTNIAAATFPDGEELALLFATKVGAAAEVIANLRWWKFIQLI